AVESAQALDELGNLFLGLDVNGVCCHGVYKSPGGSVQTFIALRTRRMTVLTLSRSSTSVRSAWLASPIGAMSWGLDSWPVESVTFRTSGGTRCRILGSRGNGSPVAQLFLTISSVSSGSRLPPPHR